MDGMFLNSDGSDAGVVEIVASRLQHLIGQQLTDENLEEHVLNEVLGMLQTAEDEIGYLSPRQGDRRLSSHIALNN